MLTDILGENCNPRHFQREDFAIVPMSLVQIALVGISGFEELVFAFLFTIGKLNFVTYLLTNLLFYNCCITNTGY